MLCLIASAPGPLKLPLHSLESGYFPGILATYSLVDRRNLRDINEVLRGGFDLVLLPLNRDPVPRLVLGEVDAAYNGFLSQRLLLPV